MKKRTLTFALAAGLLLAVGSVTLLTACSKSGSHTAHADRYQCPMHPEIVKDGPGDCPICGMKLVPIEEEKPAGPVAAPSAPGERRIALYRSPMDPRETSSTPKKDSMGMDFVPVYEDELSGTAGAPSGLAPVTIDATKRQLLGLKTVEVRRAPFSTSIRTVGRVAYDERRVHHVHTRYEAYVEGVMADFTGKFVRKGEVLAQVYSPELYATQQEYLLAFSASRSLAGSSLGNVSKGGEDLLAAARQRLLLWDIRPADIEALEKRGEPTRTLNIYAPISGFVTGRMAYHGMKVMPADTLFEIVDLSIVWVLADVYEYELPRLSVGQKAKVTLAYWPGRSWSGRVTYVYPAVDEATRTVKARLELPNPGGTLKPEMFAQVLLEGAPRQALVVPDDVVIDSGERKVVFLVEGEGRLMPREIEVSDQAEGLVEVTAGLADGDVVARGASFLVDSESRLKAALAAMAPAPAAMPAGRPEGARGPAAAPAPASPPRRPRALKEAAMSHASPGEDGVIKRIIRFSAENKYLVLSLYVIAILIAVRVMKRTPLDAIPDQSDTQVIIYSKWDRSPDIIEDQVTYPIVAALLGAPKVKTIRGSSDFGFSYVYVIFEDGTDLYWARSRVLEYLSKIQGSLPAGVKTEIGSDATSVGWVFQYALVDESGTNTTDELRSYQDWFLRYAVQSVPGVAEVATVGGTQKQYQVTIDPNVLSAYGVPISRVVEAIRMSNEEVGGRLIELSGREYMVRGRGYIKSLRDIEQIVLKTNERGTPLTIGDVGRVSLGPEIRRGIADLDGKGDVVGGIVVMRSGENALNVIERVKKKLEDIEPSLPKGVKVVTTYDRSDLIERSVSNLKSKLIEEIVVVSIIILIFLWHVPSAIVPILTIPISVVLAFIPFGQMGLTINIMSLAGIAISIGVLVDGAIVEVENAYKKLQLWNDGGRPGDFHKVRLEALMEVGPSVFFSLLVIAVAFLPVFTLVDQEGRLFKPLAFSKNLAMAIAAFLAITLDPAIRMLFARMDYFRFRPKWLAWVVNQITVGKYYAEEKHPVSRLLHRIYEPPCRLVLRHPKATIAVAVLAMAATVPAYLKLGSEFMPPLYEGSILYMPTTMPGISVTEAERLLQVQDRILSGFPEVERVFGKAGRADSSTDPAPFSMMETTVILKPETDWRRRERWYSSWAPEWLSSVFRHVWRDRISHDDLVDEMDRALKIPGTTNAWTMPIKARIDMLSTGIRTPIGIKVFGADLAEIERIGQEIETAVRRVPATRSAFAERVAGGYFIDFELKRDQLARYGLTVDEANMVIMTAIGGEPITTVIKGRERYSVSLRYPRELREDLNRLERVLVPTLTGAQVPMGQLADIRLVQGPSMIRNENGLLSGYVYVDFDTGKEDVGSFVEEAKKAVAQRVTLPQGYTLVWSGQFENMIRVRERLKVVIPITLVLIWLLMYMNTKSAMKTFIVMLAVPFSIIGAVWFLWILGYNMSIAVWVGIIALMGLDAETGIFMLLFLDLSYDAAKAQGLLRNRADLIEAIIHGAVKRVRPKAMTVFAAMLGLIPIMWSVGAGSDVMKRIAAPMVGGLVTSFGLELLVYPAIYMLWKVRSLPKPGPDPSGTSLEPASLPA